MAAHGIRDALVTAGGFPELLTAEQVSALLGVSAGHYRRACLSQDRTSAQSHRRTRSERV